jgi:hypothetical protein
MAYPVVSIRDTDYAHSESKTKVDRTKPACFNVVCRLSNHLTARKAVSFSSLVTTPKDNIGHVPSPIKSINYRT